MFSALALASALLLASQAPSSWVVLVKTDGSVPPSWNQNLQDAVQAAAKSSGAVTWVAPPAVSLEDAQLALGCGEWGPSCVGQIAAMMSADRALLVDIEARGEGAWMTHQLITTSGAVERAPVRFELPDRGRDGLKVARVVAAAAVSNKPITIVMVKTDVPGAEVFIDGKPLGKTPLTLADEVTPGRHQVELRVEGRTPVMQNVEVRAGEVTRVGAVLGAVAAASGDDVPAGAPPGSADTGPIDPLFGYLTLGAAATVALIGGGLYLGHVAYGLSRAPTPCSLRELEQAPAKRSCSTHADVFGKDNDDLRETEQVMGALYGGMIVAEIVAAALALTGAGLVIAAILTPPPDELAAP